eukprot:138592_1
MKWFNKFLILFLLVASISIFVQVSDEQNDIRGMLLSFGGEHVQHVILFGWLYLGIMFVVYSLAKVFHGVAVLEDFPEAQREIEQDIKRAKQGLADRGFVYDASDKPKTA